MLLALFVEIPVSVTKKLIHISWKLINVTLSTFNNTGSHTYCSLESVVRLSEVITYSSIAQETMWQLAFINQWCAPVIIIGIEVVGVLLQLVLISSGNCSKWYIFVVLHKCRYSRGFFFFFSESGLILMPVISVWTVGIIIIIIINVRKECHISISMVLSFYFHLLSKVFSVSSHSEHSASMNAYSSHVKHTLPQKCFSTRFALVSVV